jgi:TRAP-type C4-dicarboxylate transport system permease small subunit
MGIHTVNEGLSGLSFLKFTQVDPRILYTFMAFVLVSCGFGLGYSLQPTDPSAQAVSYQAPSIARCMSETIGTLKPAKIDNALLRETFGLCYSQLHGQGLLNDFQLRRLKFLRQDYDERHLLWMVVAITISGVLLAAVQLLASYRLAAAGKGPLEQAGEIALERDRLSLKSSITGLFILVISFAFFAVFVFGIYKIVEIDVDSAASVRKASPQQASPQQVQSSEIMPFSGKNVSQPRTPQPSGRESAR